MQSNDPFDLKRFLDAQRGSFDAALAELRAGRKETHWSWFIFPQVRGLGSSAMSVRYAIRSLAEAKAYSRIRCWGRGCGNVFPHSTRMRERVRK